MEEQQHPAEEADVVSGVGDGVDGVPVDEEEAPVSNGCEPLAGLLLAVVWAMVLHGYLSALAFAVATPEDAVSPTTVELLEYAALSSFSLDATPITFVVAPVLLVLAYVLAAVVGPGDLIGRAGVRVLQALRITGLVVTLDAVIALQALARRADRFSSSIPVGPGGADDPDPLVTFLDRLALCLPLLAGAAAVVYVTWLANRLLTDDDEPRAAGEATPQPA